MARAIMPQRLRGIDSGKHRPTAAACLLLPGRQRHRSQSADRRDDISARTETAVAQNDTLRRKALAACRLVGGRRRAAEIWFIVVFMALPPHFIRKPSHGGSITEYSNWRASVKRSAGCFRRCFGAWGAVTALFLCNHRTSAARWPHAPRCATARL